MNDWFKENYSQLERPVQRKYLLDHWEEYSVEDASNLIRLICRWAVVLVDCYSADRGTIIYYTSKKSEYWGAEFYIISEEGIKIREIEHIQYDWYE